MVISLAGPASVAGKAREVKFGIATKLSDKK